MKIHSCTVDGITNYDTKAQTCTIMTMKPPADVIRRMVSDGVQIQETSMRIHGILGRRLVHTNPHAQSKIVKTIRGQKYMKDRGKLSVATHPLTYNLTIVDTIK